MKSKFSLKLCLLNRTLNNPAQNDISHGKEIYTALRHFDSPSNACAANWFPCFQEKRHRPELCHENLSSLASDLNRPINDCFQILENNCSAICFLSCFSVNAVNACRSNRARVSASSSRDLATLQSRATCSKHSPGSHVYCELITESFLYLSFRQ